MSFGVGAKGDAVGQAMICHFLDVCFEPVEIENERRRHQIKPGAWLADEGRIRALHIISVIRCHIDLPCLGFVA